MTLTLEPAAQLSTSPDVLRKIHSDGCNLAIWERSTPTSIRQMDYSHASDVRFSASLAELPARLTQELGRANYAVGPELDALIKDIVGLAGHYCTVMQIDAVQVRLAIVTTNSCCKFHADYVKARLITTFAGTGTQWIDTEDAVRISMGEEPSRIHTLNAGDVGLFKGKMWSDTPAIHRSPPIADTGEARLMLVLDPVRKD